WFATTSILRIVPNHSISQAYVSSETLRPSARPASTIPYGCNASWEIKVTGITSSPVKPVSIHTSSFVHDLAPSGRRERLIKARPKSSTRPAIFARFQFAGPAVRRFAGRTDAGGDGRGALPAPLR